MFVFGLATTLLLVACSAGQGTDTPNAESPATTSTTLARIGTASTAAAPSLPTTTVRESPTTTSDPPDSVAAVTSGETEVFAKIGDREPFRVLPEKTVLGTPTVVSVIDDKKRGLVAQLDAKGSSEQDVAKVLGAYTRPWEWAA